VLHTQVARLYAKIKNETMKDTINEEHYIFQTTALEMMHRGDINYKKKLYDMFPSYAPSSINQMLAEVKVLFYQTIETDRAMLIQIMRNKILDWQTKLEVDGEYKLAGEMIDRNIKLLSLAREEVTVNHNIWKVKYGDEDEIEEV